MPIFISYNREDSEFADRLAKNLVMDRHNVWMDRWELRVGDSLIEKIQKALTTSSAILVLLSKHSVESEWCKKELNSGLMRELTEKQVLLIPCIIGDCEIPLFLREKLYADFRSDPDEALRQVQDSLARITNRQQGRVESPDFHTDWAYDWKQGKSSRLWYFEWNFVDHGSAMEYCVLTRCQIACNDVASAKFQKLGADSRQDYIRESLARVVEVTTRKKLKIRLLDAFEKIETFFIDKSDGQGWLVEISSRRMGIDNGMDTLMHVDQILERALISMNPEDHTNLK
jgi:hypothetical protein